MSRRPSRRKAAGATGEASPSDDAALWAHTAATVEPLRNAKPRVPDVSPPNVKPAPSVTQPKSLRVEPAEPVAIRAPSRSPRKVEPPPLAEFERRKARRVATGQTEIEARIDLHGSRQDEAHRRLSAFLSSCAAQGMTMVLVITGKGVRAARDDDSTGTVMDRPERGILRRMVPLWIAEPALRGLVVSLTSAAINHGGDGAFYVRLRRHRVAR